MLDVIPLKAKMLKTNKWKSHVRAAIQSVSLKQTFLVKVKIYEEVKLCPSNLLESQQFHEKKFPSQVVSKNFAKILIYLFV